MRLMMRITCSSSWKWMSVLVSFPSCSIHTLAGPLTNIALATIVVMASPGTKVHAGQVAGRLGEAVDGRGGGRPDNGQAGGPTTDKLDQALGMTADIVRAQLQG